MTSKIGVEVQQCQYGMIAQTRAVNGSRTQPVATCSTLQANKLWLYENALKQ